MNKSVLITGASKGIGAAIALRFAKENYDIYLNYLNSEEEAIELKEDIEHTYPVKVTILKFDVTKEEDVKKAVSSINSLDCLVNNAGIAIDNDWQDKSIEEFKKVLDTNLIGPYLVSKYASLIMASGSIINIASNSIFHHTYAEAMDYDASKAGLVAMSHNIALALAPDIRVNVVAPGWITTDMNKELSINYREEIINKSLLKRFGTKEEVANVVYFLASNEASFINDTIINVDGGYYD